MRDLEVSLIEWPNGRSAGGPMLLGTTQDSEIVQLLLDFFAEGERRKLAKLTTLKAVENSEEP